MPGSNTDFLASLALFAGLYAIGALSIRATSRSAQVMRFECQLLFVAMAVRFAASLAIYEAGLVDVFRDEDAQGWWGGVQLYNDWTQRELTFFDLPAEVWTAFEHPLGNFGYYYLLGVLFFILDVPARLPAAVLNNFFGALTVVLTYRIAGSLFSPWVANRVAWVSCFLPSLIIWAAQTLKEPVVIFLETAALYSCIQIKTVRGWLPHLIACAACIFFLVAFRFYAAYITGGAIVLALLLPRLSRGRSTMFSGVIVGGALLALLVSSGLLGQHETVFNEYSLSRLQAMRDYTARNTGSGVVLDYDLRTPSGFLFSSLTGWVHLLLAPFPWQLGAASLRMLLTLPDLLLWWGLFFLGFLPGLRIVLRARFFEAQPLLFFVLGLGTLYSITFSNVGLVYRYRAQLMPFLLILAIVGLEQRAVRALARHRSRELRLARMVRPPITARASPAP